MALACACSVCSMFMASKFAVFVNNTIFWDITPCNLVGISYHLGESTASLACHF